MAKADITNRVERMPAFEKRLGVHLEAVSAFFEQDEDLDENEVAVRGELHAANGETISDDVVLNLNVYDAEGRVIDTASDFITADQFFGFHTFELQCFLENGPISKLRLYPSAG